MRGVERGQAIDREEASTEVREDALLAWVTSQNGDAASGDGVDSDDLADEVATSDRDEASIDDAFELLGAAAN